MHALAASMQFMPSIAAESEATAHLPTTLTILDSIIGIVAAGLVLHTLFRWWSGRSATVAPSRGLPDVGWGAEAVAGPLVGYLLGYSLVSILAGAVGDAASKHALVPYIAGSAAHVGGAIVCLWIAATQFEGGLRTLLLGRPPRPRKMVLSTAAVLLVALAACPALLALTFWIVTPFWPHIAEEVHPTISLLRSGNAPTSTIVLLWLGAVIIAPVAEECFFRGILQNLLRTWYGRRWAGIAATSAVFALVHAGQPATLPAIYLLSVLLGWLYEKNASLMSPIIVHALFNARTMLWETLS